MLVYDQVWQLLDRLRPAVAAATGNQPNFDMLAFLVDPNRGDAGFSPHRDRQPDDAPGSFRADGSPKYATVWLALTKATPEEQDAVLAAISKWGHT